MLRLELTYNDSAGFVTSSDEVVSDVSESLGLCEGLLRIDDSLLGVAKGRGTAGSNTVTKFR